MTSEGKTATVCSLLSIEHHNLSFLAALSAAVASLAPLRNNGYSNTLSNTLNNSEHDESTVIQTEETKELVAEQAICAMCNAQYK